MNSAKYEYKDALKTSGFQVDFRHATNLQQKSKNRSQNITWFDPPFNKAKIFLRKINKHFPRSHRLHKIFQQKNSEDQLQLYAKYVQDIQRT